MSEICRLCLEYTRKKGVGIDYKDSNNFSVLTALNLVVPEFRKDCPKDSKICMQCYPLLLLSYKFRSKCLKTEEIITKYLVEFTHKRREDLLLNQVIEWNRNCLIDNILEQVSDSPDLEDKNEPEEKENTDNTRNKSVEGKTDPLPTVPDKTVDAVSVRPLLKTYSKKNKYKFSFVHGKTWCLQDKNVRKNKIKKNNEQNNPGTSSLKSVEKESNENTSYSIDKLISPMIEMDTEYPITGVDFPKTSKKTRRVVKKKRSKPVFKHTALRALRPKIIPKDDGPRDPLALDHMEFFKKIEKKEENPIQIKTEPVSPPPTPTKMLKPQMSVLKSNMKRMPVVRVRPVEVLNNLNIMNDEIQKLNSRPEPVACPTINSTSSEPTVADIGSINIKKEPVDYDENSFNNCENQKQPISENSSSHFGERNQSLGAFERSNEQIVQGLINNLPEIGQEFDIPEYISINKVSYKDMALLYQTSTKTKPPVQNDLINKKRALESKPNTIKRLRLIPIDPLAKKSPVKPKSIIVKRKNIKALIENENKKTKAEKTTDMEKDVCVLVTNFTSTGDYINDHDYLINPYERNNILPQIDGRSFCICVLCNLAHDSDTHVKHMQIHGTICDICGVDFHNVFILNIHVQTHTVVCGKCNMKIPYRMYKSHTNCQATSNSDISKDSTTEKPNIKQEKKNEKPTETVEPTTATENGLRRSSRLKRTKRRVYNINHRLMGTEKRSKYATDSTKELVKRGETKGRSVIKKNKSQINTAQRYFLSAEQLNRPSTSEITTASVPKKMTWLQPLKIKKGFRLKKVKKCPPPQVGPNENTATEMVTHEPATKDQTIKKYLLTKIQNVDEVKDDMVPIIGFPGYMDHFKLYFRMSQGTFQQLMMKLQATNRLEISYADLEKDVMVCLWYLGTTESLKSVAQRFNSVTFTWQTLFTIGYMIQDLNRKYNVIAWPTEEQADHITKEFKKISDVPGVIGCIKGLRMKIPIYKTNKVGICNKMVHSLYLQAVCDHRKVFTDVFLSQRGTTRTDALFSTSDLGSKRSKYVFPNNSHLVGNKDFKLRKNLMVEYTDNLNEPKRIFNHKLEQTRVTVDAAFAMLRGRFMRLKFMDSRNVDLILIMIQMACVLHNLCIQNGDKPDGILNLKNELRELQADDSNASPEPFETNDDRDDVIAMDAEEKRAILTLYVQP